MIEKDAKFYFANLGADVARCIAAAQNDDDERYKTSLTRARSTLQHLRKLHAYTAYEEGLLLLRGLSFAKARGKLKQLSNMLNTMITQISGSMLQSR